MSIIDLVLTPTLWQTAAMSWIATYNEFVKNASKLSEYRFNLFSPRSKVKDKEDK